MWSASRVAFHLASFTGKERILPLTMNPVAADVSPLHLEYVEVRADSRRLLQSDFDAEGFACGMVASVAKRAGGCKAASFISGWKPLSTVGLYPIGPGRTFA
jgi:hypothetical protein